MAAVFMLHWDRTNKKILNEIPNSPMTDDDELIEWNSLHVIHGAVKTPKKGLFADAVRTCGNTFLFSELGRDLLVSMCIDGPSAFATIDIVYRGNVVATRYALLHGMEKRHVLHETFAKFKASAKTPWFIDSVSEWVLDTQRIPDCDIFIGDTREYFVSGRFRDAWEGKGLTGLRFTEVPVR